MKSLQRLSRVKPGWGIAGFVDVETTGLSPRYDEVVELALVLFAFDRQTGGIVGIVDEYVGLREPGRSIPRDASEVHGLTMDGVRGCCLDCGVIERLIARAEFLVAHNASFDRGFVFAHRIATARAHRGGHDVKSSLQLLAYCPMGCRSYFSKLLDTLKEA